MPTLDQKFKKAQDDVNALPERPDNNTALRLYALYKQATKGDASGDRPGMFDMIGRAKYDAWAEVKGLSTDDAKTQYINLAATLTK